MLVKYPNEVKTNFFQLFWGILLINWARYLKQDSYLLKIIIHR